MVHEEFTKTKQKLTDRTDLSHDHLYNPTLEALRHLGGSGRNQEIYESVAEILSLTAAKHQEIDQSELNNLSYRLGWAKTWLKKYGLIDNSQRGVWSLTRKGWDTDRVDSREVNRVVAAMTAKEKNADTGILPEEMPDSEDNSSSIEGSANGNQWRETLLRVMKEMAPIAFERLCQRILRESGFTQVEVTQASRDGGIDGWGILQVNDFLSFRVEFQCKRYEGSVGPNVVQQLRGAMQGSVDRGLIITTGRFTKGARDEATRGDKVPIELVDGEGIVDWLKKLELGVSTEMVPRVTVDPDFFANI